MAGQYLQQVVNYTGDGTAARLIATTNPLNTGKVAVWICGGAVGVSDFSCFRHNGAGMSGTSIMGSSTLQTTFGIMTFVAGGFTVTYGSIAGIGVANNLNTKYTAIVLIDTTTNNTYLQIGNYAGNGVGPRTISVGGTATITHLWIWGRSVAYRSNDFTGDSFITLARTADPITNGIISLGNGSFVVGNDVNSNVNDATLNYYYAALGVDNAFTAQKIFASFKGTGIATPPTVITGLGFTPAVAFARQYVGVGTTTGCVWRGADHTGTTSGFCSLGAAGNPDLPTTGITAMALDTISASTEIAPNAVDFYGWVFKGSGSFPIVPPVLNIPDPWFIHQLDFQPRSEEQS